MFIKLIWKEWCENLWKLLFCTAVSGAFISLLFKMRIIPDEGNCLLISTIQMFVVPVVYSLDIFSGEMSNRTIHLLFKIPVSRPKIFLSKFILSALSIFLVFLLSGILMELVSGGREVWTFYLLKKNLMYGCTAVMLFVWFSPFGCQSRSEAGSLAAMFGVMIGLAIIYMWAKISEVGWALAAVPFSMVWDDGILPQNAFRVSILWIALSQVAALFVVASIACFRYTRIRRYL